MKLSKQLQVSEKLQAMKKRLIDIEKEYIHTMDSMDTLYRELNNIEKDLDLSTLGKFGSISFGTITHGDRDIYIYYGGNVGNTDDHINKCLTYFGWPDIDQLRELSSFQEDGIPSEFYRAEFSIDEYGEVFSNRHLLDDEPKQNKHRK